MSGDIWVQLAAPFPRDALEWRILRLSEEGSSAQVRPKLRFEAVTARLDEVLGVPGWSYVYGAVDQEALSCTLTIQGVSKAAVVALARAPRLNHAECAEDALVYAAERFGLKPPADVWATYWVDYDSESGELLYEPEAAPSPPAQPGAAEAKAPAATPAARPESEKPAGQQAIDRLVERLKQEGLGLEAAKLLVEYGGYGQNPEAARELYAKLREALKRKTEAGS